MGEAALCGVVVADAELGEAGSGVVDTAGVPERLGQPLGRAQQLAVGVVPVGVDPGAAAVGQPRDRPEAVEGEVVPGRVGAGADADADELPAGVADVGDQATA